MGIPYRQKGAAHSGAPTLLPQVQATLGALWDAFEDIAVYMEVLKVQTLVEAPRGEAPAAARACEVGGVFRVRVKCCRTQAASAAGGGLRAEQRRFGRVAATGLFLMFVISPLALIRLAMLPYLRNRCFSACTAPSRVSGGRLLPAQEVTSSPALECALRLQRACPAVPTFLSHEQKVSVKDEC